MVDDVSAAVSHAFKVGFQDRQRQVDVDMNSEAADLYQVTSLPTLVFIRNQKVLGRYEGGCERFQMKNEVISVSLSWSFGRSGPQLLTTATCRALHGQLVRGVGVFGSVGSWNAVAVSAPSTALTNSQQPSVSTCINHQSGEGVLPGVCIQRMYIMYIIFSGLSTPEFGRKWCQVQMLMSSP